MESLGLGTSNSYGNEISITCSFFNCVEDATPKPWVGSWPDLVVEFQKTNTPRQRENGDSPKKGLPAIAGASFCPHHRGKAEAQSLQLVGLDFDNAADELIPGEFHPSGRPKTRKVVINNPVTFGEVTEALSEAGALAFQWTTWSDADGFPKHRAIVALAHPVPAALWPQITEWALLRLGLEDARRGLDLGALRDVARMYFLPGHPAGADAIRRAEVQGKALTVPLEQMQELNAPALATRSKFQLARDVPKAGKYAWASHLQVDLSTLRLADVLSSLGVRVSLGTPYQGGTRWRTHCLWPEEHTGGLDDDSGFIIHEPGRWPTWSCSHTCHLQLGLVDVLRTAGVI